MADQGLPAQGAPAQGAPGGPAALPVPDADGGLRDRVSRVLAPTFDLDREIGRGGMGIVYRAVDRRLKRAVAVKVLPPDLAFRSDIRTRFLHEAEMSAQLSHPSIVPIYTVDERDGLVYFVMAYVDGQTLAHYLKSVGGPLPVREARRILRQVASALAYAHAHGVIHRDIKPDNVLLDADGSRVMVTDFGIARAVTAVGDSRLTATGVAIGTPAYMSPEQCAGDKEVDGRSDLYSLGVVAYQMLCGSLPFTGGNTASLLVKQLSESPIPLGHRCPTVPAGLSANVMRLLAKNPDDRFPNADAFLAALDDDTVSSPAPAPAPAPHWVPPPRDQAWAPPPPARPPFAPLPPVAAYPTADPGDQQWRTGLHKLSKRERREQREALRAAARGEPVDADPRLRRIRKFRGMVVSLGCTMVFLTAINLVTDSSYFWAIWPIMGMTLAIGQAGGRLWADGISPWQAFGPRARQALANSTLTPPAPALTESAVTASAAGLAPPPVLAGPYGAAVRRAALDRDRIRDLVTHLDRADLTLVPSARATADALADQIGGLAAALHRIDVETPAQQQPALAERRTMLTAQLERASLLLQTLYLDLLRLRMSDASSGASGVASVTEQATALSRDIGYVLGAADEIRALDGRPRDR